ncbi:hypothetical protein B0H11DRAFT_2193437 [Mycena galericulata]|nr:hypothetical protein B0H11DRAFT_2193437 [Mycena galericulata]
MANPRADALRGPAATLRAACRPARCDLGEAARVRTLKCIRTRLDRSRKKNALGCWDAGCTVVSHAADSKDVGAADSKDVTFTVMLETMRPMCGLFAEMCSVTLRGSSQSHVARGSLVALWRYCGGSSSPASGRLRRTVEGEGCLKGPLGSRGPCLALSGFEDGLPQLAGSQWVDKHEGPDVVVGSILVRGSRRYACGVKIWVGDSERAVDGQRWSTVESKDESENPVNMHVIGNIDKHRARTVKSFNFVSSRFSFLRKTNKLQPAMHFKLCTLKVTQQRQTCAFCAHCCSLYTYHRKRSEILSDPKQNM